MIRILLTAALLFTVTGCRDSATDLMAKARMAAYEKKPQEALAHYRTALDVIERDGTPEAEVLKARALRGAADVYHYELQDLRQAVAVYRELLAQCPEAPETLEARVILADILQMRFNDIRGAITELTAALQRNPPASAELHYRVAKLYFQLQDYPQCELEANRVATKYETSAFVDDALLLRAQALAMIETRRGEAVRAFEDIIHRFPDSELTAHALFELGKLRDDAGEDEAAIAYWVQSLKSHPQPQVVQSQIARVRERITNTTPRGVGNRLIALDRAAPVIVVKHSSSDEAMGVRVGARNPDTDGEHVDATAAAAAPKTQQTTGNDSVAVKAASAPATDASVAAKPAAIPSMPSEATAAPKPTTSTDAAVAAKVAAPPSAQTAAPAAPKPASAADATVAAKPASTPSTQNAPPVSVKPAGVQPASTSAPVQAAPASAPAPKPAAAAPATGSAPVVAPAAQPM